MTLVAFFYYVLLPGTVVLTLPGTYFRTGIIYSCLVIITSCCTSRDKSCRHTAFQLPGTSTWYKLLPGSTI